MDIDQDRIDETVLALLFLGRHDGVRTWKSLRLGCDGAASRQGPNLKSSRQSEVRGIHRPRPALFRRAIPQVLCSQASKLLKQDWKALGWRWRRTLGYVR